MRHGAYSGKHEDGLNDLGKEQVNDVAAQLIEAGLIPNLIVYSHFARAVHTAQLLRDAFYKSSGLFILHERAEWLAYESDTTIGNARKLDNGANMILAVSHEYNIKGLVRELTGAREIAVGCAQASVLSDNINDWTKLHGKATLVQTLRPRG